MDVYEIINYFYADEEALKDVLLKHSGQVKDKALAILDASNLAVDEKIVAAGSMLHDIGIIKCHAPSILCNGKENYIAHGIIGAEMLRSYGRENGIDLEIYARICERHTGSGLTAEDIKNQHLPLPEQDFLPETAAEKIICLADKFFSKSGDMAEKPFEAVRRSMAKFGDDSLRRFDDLVRFCNMKF